MHLFFEVVLRGSPNLHEAEALGCGFAIKLVLLCISYYILFCFYFRCTVPMRDKEGKQDYRYFFFNRLNISRTENLLNFSNVANVIRM